MNEESRVAKLYTKILHNLKTKDCTHKLCFIKKNNKVEPIILRVNLSLNTTSDAYKTSSASCEGTRTIMSTGQHRKYRLIEPIVKPRPKLADSEKELEDELQVFKAEVEKKYQESQTNTSYKYPLQSRNSQCIFANSDDDVHTENMAAIIPSTIYYLKEDISHSIDKPLKVKPNSNSLESTKNTESKPKKYPQYKNCHKNYTENETFYDQIHRILAQKRNKHSDYSTNSSLYYSQNISDFQLSKKLKKGNKVNASTHIPSTNKIQTKSRNVIQSNNNGTTYKHYLVHKNSKNVRYNANANYATNQSVLSTMKTISVNCSSALNSTTYYKNSSKPILLQKLDTQNKKTREMKFNNTMTLRGIGGCTK